MNEREYLIPGKINQLVARAIDPVQLHIGIGSRKLLCKGFSIGFILFTVQEQNLRGKLAEVSSEINSFLFPDIK